MLLTVHWILDLGCMVETTVGFESPEHKRPCSRAPGKMQQGPQVLHGHLLPGHEKPPHSAQPAGLLL